MSAIQPPPEYLFSYINKQAETNPDSPVLFSEGRDALNYSRLHQQVQETTGALYARGLRDGDTVAILLPEGAELAVACLAVASGFSCAPINIALKESELHTCLLELDARALIILSGEEVPVAASTLGIDVLELEPVVNAEAGIFTLRGRVAGNNSRPSVTPDAIAFILQTSGTTARAKYVKLSQKNICIAAKGIVETLELTSSDRCLVVMPLFHIHGLSTMFASLVAGGSVVVSKKFSVQRFVMLTDQYQPTWYSAAPSLHQIILDGVDERWSSRKGRTFRLIRSASAPMPEATQTALAKMFNTLFIEAYGMTEAAPLIASNRLPPHKQKTGSVGQAVGTEVVILDQANNEMESGIIGEIAIRGANVAHVAELNSAWFRTGDLGYLDSEGYLFLTGRIKDVINQGGEKILPREIEAVLLRHPAVAQAAVFSVPHPVLGEAVAAALVLKSGFDGGADTAALHSRLLEVIRKFAGQYLAYFKLPQQMVIVSELPQHSTGKLQRDRLLEMLACMPESTGDFELIQHKLADIWCEVLGAGSPLRNDNFFRLGGHSLTAMQVISRIENVFNVKISIETFFARPTLSGQAEYIKHAGKNTTQMIHRDDNRRLAPLSFSQYRLWFLNQIDNSGAYNMSVPLWMTGNLDFQVLENSLEEIQHRHQVLRTRIRMRDDEPELSFSEAVIGDLSIIDLANLPDEKQESEARRLEKEAAGLPFDLVAGPLFRMQLLRLNDHRHLLLLTLHHIISDAWSTAILHRELAVIYRALMANRPIPLPELPIQYGDFTEWQRAQASQAGLAEQLAYWKGQLGDAPPLLALPYDRPRPAKRAYQGARLPFTIDVTLFSGLKALSEQSGATLNMVLLAGFKALLLRYSGQDDIVVGTPVANRTRVETESLIGFFANTLVLRSDLSGDPRFSEVLARVRATSIAAFSNQDLPFERLVEALSPSRDLSHEQLFQLMFVFQNSIDQSCLDFSPDLRAEVFPGDRDTAKFDLTLYLSESEQCIQGVWQYDVALFDSATIARFNRHFECLLTAIVADSECRISELPLIDGAESECVKSGCNPNDDATLQATDFVERLLQQADKTPRAIALVYGEERLDYQTLNSKTNQLAHYLLDRGVKKNNHVGIALSRSSDMVIAVLAVLKIGGTYVPLDPNDPAEAIASALVDTGVSALIVHDHLPETDLVQINLHADWKSIKACSNANPDVEISGDSLAYIISTSGSTGDAKRVLVTHANLASYISAMSDELGILPGDRYLHTASLTFSSSVRQIVLALSCGACVHVAPRDVIADPEALLQLVKQHNITVIDLVPTYSRSCLNVIDTLEPECRRELLDNDLRLMLYASEPLSSEVPSRWQALMPHSVSQINMYGQTETTGIVATYAIPEKVADNRIIPIGKPINNTRIYVLDRQLRVVPVGVVGEIYVGGAGVAAGYLNQTELTSECFIADHFSRDAEAKLYKSGDRARYRPDGVIEFVGRIDHQVKVRGFRIEPEGIEAVLRTHEVVHEAVVVVQEHRLVAFVVLKPGSGRLDLSVFLTNILPAYMIPTVFSELESIPLTKSGKFDRKALRMQQVEQDHTNRYGFRLAETETEKLLATVWKDVLQLDEVSVNDNFFDLGGDSILSVQVVTRAAGAGLNIKLKQLFQYQNIAELAVAVDPQDDSDRSLDYGSKIEVSIDKLRILGRQILEQAGLSEEGAAIVTEVQLESSLRGQQTHNIGDLPRYARRLQAGILNPQPNIRIEKESAFSAQLDGDNAPGQWVATVAMQTAIQKARASGVGVVAVRQSNHFGAAAHYVWMATQQGLIAILTTNGPLIMAPTGGVTPTFGNNPIGIGLPAENHQPILLDISLSAVPRGKVGLDLAEGNPLLPGWILDRFGRPSTRLADLAAGLAAPMGGHKGSGLALSMEGLAGALAGAGFCWDHNRHGEEGSAALDVGHFMIVLDPEVFMPLTEFKERIDRMVEQTKTGELAVDVEDIRIPGEYEMLERKRNLSAGMVPLRASTHRALRTYAEKAGLTADF